MGGLISRWKTKQTTVEQLETLDKEIKELEEFRAKNQRLQKLWVGRLLLYSSVLYLLTCLVVYCLYLPEQWLDRIAMALPFFIYPVLVWFIRKLLIFLFSKRTERNSDKLEELKAAKKKILEEVMETETYKNAKLILERFDPEAKKKAELESTPVRPQMTPRPGQEIRQRGVAMRPMPMGTPAAMTPPPGARPPMGPGGTPVEPVPLSAPGGPPERSALSASVLQGAIPRTPSSPIPGVGLHPPGPPLARPILPKDRGAMDRVIEYLVGDGPQNRYALICQHCFSHNGMALKEEFEYLAFRCAYCYFLNPARKTRPQAPRLPEFSYERRLRAESRSPGPMRRSGTDTEESAPPSGDEKELGEDEGPTKGAESDSQSEELQQQVEEEREEEVVQEEVEEEEVESEQSHSTPCESESQPS
ncbi:endoplasmic reticulum junction formation protein lunapark-B isoform X3 [Epinephelus fuscoguttatus]|uniref:endoplasmic reticulum junction formation protein lunapark-B isoform X3 n=1 Tax=Epinephelus fuscoguttatus TaxID=293821 RepID=UPI0020D1B30F|nr:endoplasmic reticulum junction formation protein lunapark-B isoform X3 [Epinephelus fuscoguttatus]